jgi:nucleoside-diphosphate-sugar epimerase
MKTALVIGGTGATGPYIIDGLLQRDYEVTVLHRGVHEAELPPQVKHIHADPHWLEKLQEALAGKKFDLVIADYGRLKRIAEVAKGLTSRLISVGGAMAIYKGWMRISEPHPWSSMEESPVPIKEDDPLATAPGVDRFAERARAAEQAVMEGHRQGYYNATHFRYPIIYGPRHPGPAEWCIIRRIKEGRKRIIVPGGGMALVSRGYAENLAHGIMLAVDNPTASAGQIYNISDERILSNREWIRLVSRIMGHEFEFIEIPFNMLRADFNHAPVQALIPYHRVMDITKIKEQLGYREIVPPERGMELTVKWLLQNPLEKGGEVEQSLGDPFDYAIEDKLIDIYLQAKEELTRRFWEAPEAKTMWRHPYPHPKSPDELK